MSISSTTRKAGPYIGDGVTTVLPFSFKVFSDHDVRVIRTDLSGNESDMTITSQYTVNLNSDQDANPGGSIALMAAASNGYLTTVTSQLDYFQPVVLTNAGGFYPKVINDALDRLTILIQQLGEKVSRSLQYSISSPIGDAALPSPAANHIIGWNSAANGFQNYAPSDNTLLSASLSAASGSSLIGFLQAGFGAVASNTQNKLREVISVTDFGAIGNGIANDSSAVKAAITAASGKAVYFPNGTYNLASWNATGETFTNVNLYGKGAVLKGPASGTAVFLKPTGTPVIDGLVFDSWGYVFNKVVADGGTITGGRFENNYVLNTSGIGINLEIPTTGFNVTKNVFDGGSCLHAVRIGTNDNTLQAGWKHNTISFNEIKNLSTTGTNNMLGMLIYGQHTKVNGNKIRNLRSINAECIGIYTKLMFSEISGNVIEDITSTGSSGAHLDVVGISLKGLNRGGAGVSPYGYKNVCTGNTVKTIGVQGVKGTGIRTQCEENNISNNSIEDVGYMGIDINDSGTIGSIVCGNEIRGYNITGLYGIWSACTGIGWVISNNIIRDYPSGIRIDGLANPNRGGRITGNFISNSGAVSYGVNFASAVMSNIMISNNTFDVGGAVVINGSATVSAVKLIENDTLLSKDRGAILWSGTLPADTAIRFNSGHPSHSGGSVTVPNGAGGLVITHGLFETPSVLHAIGFNNSSMTCTWSGPGATQLTLTHSFGSPQAVSYCAYTPHYFN